jgi:hypothetical protein
VGAHGVSIFRNIEHENLRYFVIGITNVSGMSATGAPRIAYEVVE